MLVDVTPPALIERLRAGKVYKAERVQAALNGFFRIENLEALREVALRQVAEGVEAKRLVREPPPVRDEHRVLGQAAPQAVGERLLAIVTPQASSQRVVRRAWRSAQRLGAELDILTVLAPGRDPSRRGGRAARRAAAARLVARRDRHRRRGRRRARRGRARRARARDDVRADGRAGGARPALRLRR